MSFRSALRVRLRRLAALELGVYAANASFFILLSLFPGMMLLIGLLQYTPLTAEDLLAALAPLFPAALQPLLDYMTQELFVTNSVALVSFSAVLALWTASKGAVSLLRGLNRVYRLRERRGWLRVRLRCTVFTLLLLAALLMTASLHLFGQRLAAQLAASEDPLLRFLGGLLRMKYWLMALLLSGLFSLIYALLPEHAGARRPTLPGAAVAAVGWEVFSALFSSYVLRFGHYSLYYGSLSVIALTMLWLYVCMLILFLGAVLNCRAFPELAKRLEKRGLTRRDIM